MGRPNVHCGVVEREPAAERTSRADPSFRVPDSRPPATDPQTAYIDTAVEMVFTQWRPVGAPLR